jgi:hypothetical protein
MSRAAIALALAVFLIVPSTLVHCCAEAQSPRPKSNSEKRTAPPLQVYNAGSKDPIAYWKKLSGDGEGREILAALSLILEAGYVVLPLGADLENNRLYIWPYFSEVPLDKLTHAQEVELLRLVPPAAAKAMKSAGKYTHWRLTIGADGAWHSFRKATDRVQ